MKSELDARLVYLQKRETITRHFLICYLAVLFTSLLQFRGFDNKYCSEEIFNFIIDFRMVKISERKYMNLTRSSKLITNLTQQTGLPLTSYFFIWWTDLKNTKSQILNCGLALYFSSQLKKSGIIDNLDRKTIFFRIKNFHPVEFTFTRWKLLLQSGINFYN